MARIFSSADIAAVVTAYQPSRPSSQTPSLVWSNKGDRLRHSGKVQNQFDALLKNNEDRLSAVSLSQTLDVKDHDWCLGSQKQPLVYSANLHSILPANETQRLLSELNLQATDSYVNLSAFATEHTVDMDSLRSAIERIHADDVEIVYVSQGKTYTTWLYSRELNAKIESSIEQLMRDSGEAHRTDLSADLPNVPRFFVQSIAEKISRTKDIKGTVRSGKTRITFISAAYEARIKEQQTKKVTREFSKILVKTHGSGYHVIPEDTEDAPGLRQVFFERTKAGLDDGSFSLLHVKNEPVALAFTNRLETLLEVMKARAIEMVDQAWKDGDAQATTLPDARVEVLIEESSSQEFARLILDDEKYRAAVQKTMTDKISDLGDEDLQRCNESFNLNVRTPITLYLTGLNAAQDIGLRRRLEEFVFEFLRKDLIPSGVSHLEESEKQIRNQPFGKELERFTQACDEAKSVAELQSALTRFTRKQRLEAVNKADEAEVRSRILHQKAKSMRKMVRSSDILQNLVWILLAQQHDGLFISSGRDTTRIIRFYQAAGSQEYGQKLEAWKDQFKAGQETREDVEEMRFLADDILAKADAEPVVRFKDDV